MKLWRTIRDLIRNDIVVRPHGCHGGHVITRLSQQDYAAWIGCGQIACPRCGLRMWSIGHPAGTDLLIADMRAAAADCPRDGQTPNT
jgi:hypothetical protein